MRRLATSQRIAQLYKRIERLEKQAGVFDSFSAEVLKSASKGVLEVLAKEKLIGNYLPYTAKLKYLKRGLVETVSVKESEFKLLVSKTFISSQPTIVALLVVDGKQMILGKASYYTMDSQASVKKLLAQIERNLKTEKVGGEVHEALTGYNPFVRLLP